MKNLGLLIKEKLQLSSLLCIVSTVTVSIFVTSYTNCSQLTSLPFTSIISSHNANKPVYKSQAKTIKIGVLVIRGKDKAKVKWQPTIDYLSQKIPDCNFQLLPLEINKVEDIIANKTIDFVLLNPGMYVNLESKYKVRRIATLQNLYLNQSYNEFGAVIFRHKNSTDIQELKDLKGKSFMAVSPIAFGGWQMAWETIEKAGIEPKNDFQSLKFGGTHDAVVYGVLNGVADAGTVRTHTLERMAQEGKINLDDLVILEPKTQPENNFPFALSTKLYPEWPFAMMSHTDTELAEKVAISLIEMPASSFAAQMGEYQGWTIPANYQSVHNTLKYLHVHPYENWGKITFSQALYQYRYWLGLTGLLIFGFTYSAVYLIQRRRSEQKLRQINGDLEKWLETRTAQLIQAKEKAEIANQTKGEFLSHMSSELRTPLNNILGYAQILQRDRSLTFTQNYSLKIIHDSGNHLLTLINDILDLARIEDCQLELDPTEIDLAIFLSGIVGIIKMRGERKNLSFKYQALTPLPTKIVADEKRLRQILLNLLDNAVKFTDQGEVTLNICAAEYQAGSELAGCQTFRFGITDTGIGIKQQQLSKIFQAFEQVETRKRLHQGTGLGLTISKRLVELMGGQLQVTSQWQKGSTFWFDVTFPVIQEVDCHHEAQKQQGKIIGYRGKRKHILVVDDQKQSRLVLQSMLEPLGFDVTLAEDGQQEIDLAQKIKPDCILTDLVMPIKTGFEAVQEIRKIPAIKNIIMIAISASILDFQEQKNLLIDYDSFLAKPVNETQLLATLQQYLQVEWIFDDFVSF